VNGEQGKEGKKRVLVVKRTSSDFLRFCCCCCFGGVGVFRVRVLSGDLHLSLFFLLLLQRGVTGGNMAPAKGVEGEQKGGKSKGLKKPGRPPKAEKKPVVEGSSKGPGKKGKKAKKNIETYKIYIYKVLKQVSHCFLHLASSLCLLPAFVGSFFLHSTYVIFHVIS
jgi:hypothetical protein